MLSEQTAASHFDIKQNKYVLTNPRRAAKQTSSCPKTSLTDMISRAFSTGKSALREQDGPIIISVFKVLFSNNTLFCIHRTKYNDNFASRGRFYWRTESLVSVSED